MKFDELIDRLPREDSLPLVPDADHCTGRIYNVAQSAGEFVPPEFDVELPIQEGAALILIEAPGAVGKTMLAREIAHRTGGALWHLGRLYLGSNTLRGTIGRCYGRQADELYGQVMQRLREGSLLIVLDALDEGRLGTGHGAFEAFLGELADLCREPRKSPTIVVLGRRDAIEISRLVFDIGLDLPLSYGYLRIAYFEEDAAKEFIDKRMDILVAKNNIPPSHKIHRAAFEAVRDTFFERVKQVLNADWNDLALRSFLGYAPVLIGIAEFLADPDHRNFPRMEQRLKDAAVSVGPAAMWELFREVLDGILEREQGKVRGRMKDTLAEVADAQSWDSWELLYTPDEQRRRLLALALNLPSPRLPDGLPKELREQYEESLQAQLPEHPFWGGADGETDGFAGVSFRDDVYGWCLASGTADAAQKDALRGRLQLADYSSSVVLARSLLARLEPRSVEETTIDAIDFGHLYESLWSYGNVDLEVSQIEAEDVVLASLRGTGLAGVELRLRLRPSPAGIMLPRRLINAKVNVKLPVSLGAEASMFNIGPNVDLTCSELFILASEVVINRGNEATPEYQRKVRLCADSCLHSHHPPRVEGVGTLEAKWPDPEYPWDRWVVAPSLHARDEFGDEMFRAIRYLANHSASLVNLEEDETERRIIGPVLDSLRTAGILVENPQETSGDTRLRPAVAQQMRMVMMTNQDDISKGKFPEAILGALRPPEASSSRK